MTLREEILDSEDECEPAEYGSEDDEAVGVLPLVPTHTTQDAFNEARDATTTRAPVRSSDSTNSTNPSLFQQFYEQQRAAVYAPDILGREGLLSADVRLSSASEGKRVAPKASSSLSSLTDPASLRTPAFRAEAGIDLTQPRVTTPGRPAALGLVDPWKVPGSGEAWEINDSYSGTRSSGRVKKMYGKRKRGGLKSSPRHEISTSSVVGDNEVTPVDDDYEILMPTRKKSRHATRSSSLQTTGHSIDVEVLHSEERTSHDPRRSLRSGDHSSSLGRDSNQVEADLSVAVDTTKSTPTSQKEQHKTFSLSLLGGEDHEALQLEQSKSSGTTTVPNTTPSGSASTGIRALADDVRPAVCLVEKLPPLIPSQPLSSPDVRLNVSAEGRTRRQPGHGEDVPPSSTDTLEMPRNMRRMARRDEVFEARTRQQDDSRDSDTTGAHRELYDRRSSRRKGTGDAPAPSMPDTQPPWNSSEELTAVPRSQDEIPVSIEDGIPKIKEALATDGSPDEVVADAPEPSAENSRAKSKRGRKKKWTRKRETISDVSGLEDAPVLKEPEPGPAPDVVETMEPAKKKRGRPGRSAASNTSTEKAVGRVFSQSGREHSLTKKAAQSVDEGLGTLAGEEAEKEAEEEAEEEDKPSPQPTRKAGNRGRKDKAASATAQPPQEVTPDALQEIAPNRKSVAAPTRRPETTSAEAVHEANGHVKVSGEKSAVKNTTTDMSRPGSANQSGKVPYRVGLSKRSQIAPLLKSLRK